MPALHAALHAAAIAISAVLFAGCSAQAQAPASPDTPHRSAEGFRNLDGSVIAKPFSQLLLWKWQSWREGLPAAPRQPTPRVAADLAALRANTTPGRPSATWIGHATVLVQAGGLNVLTDPVFSERASPVQFAGPARAQPPGIALADLPPIDVVLVSHNHYDHLDRDSILALHARGNGRTVFLVPLGLKAWMAEQGVPDAIELDWWDAREVRGVPFQLVPVQHWSARGLGDRNRTEAVQAHRDLGARQSIGIHWGTFELTDEALDQPPRDLAQAREQAGVQESEFGVLAIGQTRWLSARVARQSAP
jgi:N-acyl-phosphatidylethanolamine-hydrolysing phospholipase D